VFIYCRYKCLVAKLITLQRTYYTGHSQIMFIYNVYLLYEQGYVITCVGNLKESKFFVSMFEFPTGVLTPEVYGKDNIATL
jgi:hypothetical protein